MPAHQSDCNSNAGERLFGILPLSASVEQVSMHQLVILFLLPLQWRVTGKVGHVAMGTALSPLLIRLFDVAAVPRPNG